MRILLVEDDRSLADALKRGLAEHMYAVDAATDGEEALLLTRMAAYDVVVLDVMLPRVKRRLHLAERRPCCAQPEPSADIRLASTHAVQCSADAVVLMFAARGSSSVTHATDSMLVSGTCKR